MGQACAALPAPAPFEEFTEMAQRQFRDWIATLRPLFEGREAPPTLTEVSEFLFERRGDLMASLLKSALSTTHEAELERTQAPCPQCAKLLPRKRLDQRRLSTLHGRATIERPYFYCPRCQLGFHPADEALGVAREEHQWDVQQALTRLAADLPYETAAEHFERLTAVSAGAHFEHDILNAVGESATLEEVVPSAEEIEARIAAAEKGAGRWRPVLVVAADGAYAPLRPPGARQEKRGEGVWQEVKGVRLYLLGAGERITPLVSWHRLASAQEIGEDLQRIAARIPRRRVRIALVGDGSQWVWKVLGAAFPEGQEILDYYHCSEYVHETAELQFGDTLKGWQWAEAQLTLLALGEVEQVVAGLSLMRGRTAKAREWIEGLKEYLLEHERRIDYQKFKRAGLPRGSGAMESANKFIAHVRLKRPGAWWLKDKLQRHAAHPLCALQRNLRARLSELRRPSESAAPLFASPRTLIVVGCRANGHRPLQRLHEFLRQSGNAPCRGITDWPGKLLSLFVPRTAVIRKGKAHKPNEFGRLIDIVEVENGIVSDYRVLDGNPDDGSLLLPALKRHQQRFGRVPHLVATDRGFWSAKNERAAHALGVKRVAIPATGKLARTRLRLQRSRWFRQAQRWRAAGEGRIGTLKNVFGMDRCMYKDVNGREDDAMERWVGWCVFAHNLVFVARALRRREPDGNQSGTTAGQSDQAAA